jgi:hypothetical protein
MRAPSQIAHAVSGDLAAPPPPELHTRSAMPLAYRTLSGIVGAALAALGLALFASYFAYQRPGSEAPLPGGPHAHYFAATAGCALIAWGGALAAGAIRGDLSRSLGTTTALALVLLALMRVVAWFSGDYYAVAGDLPRAEAAAFLLAALGFVWLRPRASERKIWS